MLMFKVGRAKTNASSRKIQPLIIIARNIFLLQWTQKLTLPDSLSTKTPSARITATFVAQGADVSKCTLTRAIIFVLVAKESRQNRRLVCYGRS